MLLSSSSSSASASPMTTITMDLLDSLVSPDPNQRCQAETYYNSLPIPVRCGGLLEFLLHNMLLSSMTITSTTTTNNKMNAMILLSTVLVRREILTLTKNGNHLQLVQDMIPPLCHLFFHHTTTTTTTITNTETTTRTSLIHQNRDHDNHRLSVGHCLTAMGRTLSLWNCTTECNDMVQALFQSILRLIETITTTNNTSRVEIPSIRLMAQLAHMVPLSFSRSGGSSVMHHIVQSAVCILSSSSLNDNYNQSHEYRLLVWTLIPPLIEMVVMGAMAYQTTAASNDDIAITMSMIHDSIGQSCLLPLLPFLIQGCYGGDSGGGYSQMNDPDAMIPALQHLVYAAVHCPGLFWLTSSSPEDHCFHHLHRGSTTGSNHSLVVVAAVLPTFQNLASASPTTVCAQIRLIALEILTSLLSSSSTQSPQHDMVELVIHKNSLFSSSLDDHKNVLVIGTRLFMEGLDDDIDDWATEPLLVVAADTHDSHHSLKKELESLRWDPDCIAEDTERLLLSLISSHWMQSSSKITQWLDTIVPALLVSHQYDDNDNNDSLPPTLWKRQVAALMILECCLMVMMGGNTTNATTGGMMTMMNPHLRHLITKSLEVALPLAHNNNVRVQYRALWLLGVICEIVSSSSPSSHDDADANCALDSVLRPYASSLLQCVLENISSSSSSSCPKVICMALDVLSSMDLSFFLHLTSEQHGLDKTLLSSVIPTLMDIVVHAASRNHHNSSSSVVAMQIRALSACASWMVMISTKTNQHLKSRLLLDFYTPIMSVLWQLLHGSSTSRSNQYEMIVLRGTILEVVAILGQAVGIEHYVDMFQKDAHDWLQQVILPILQQVPLKYNDNDDNDQQYLKWAATSACARMASVMQNEFLPAIPIVLPHLLQCVMTPPNVQIHDSDENDLESSCLGGGGEIIMKSDLDNDDYDDDGMESITVTIPGRGLTKVTVDMAKLQNKAIAARVVYELATSLQADFVPFASTCLDAFLTLVDFPYASEVRQTSAQALSAVYQATCRSCGGASDPVLLLAPPSQTSKHPGLEMVQLYLPNLMTALARQVEKESSSLAASSSDQNHDNMMEVLCNITDALSDILYNTYHMVVIQGNLTAVDPFRLTCAKGAIQSLMNSMALCLDRRSQLLRTLQQNRTVVINQQLRREEQLLTSLVDSVGYTLKMMRESFMTIFDDVVSPVLSPYLTVHHNGIPVVVEDVRARHAAICLWDDCIEHCGPVAVNRHAPSLAAAVGWGIHDASNGCDPDLKQAALYGLCQLSRHAPPEILVPQIPTLLPLLLAIVCQPNNQNMFLDESNHYAEVVTNQQIIENAVSALASMALIGKAPLASTVFELVPKETIIQIFLTNLPLTHDEDEAKICHDGFCSIVEQELQTMGGDREKFSQQLFDVQNTLRIIGDTLDLVSNGEDVASPLTCQRMVHIVHFLQTNVAAGCMVSANRIQQAFETLSEDAQCAIEQAMQQHYYHQQNTHVITP